MKKILVLSALFVGATTFANTHDKSAQNKGEVKVGEINRNPQKFVNKSVTVSGEVEKLGNDQQSFVLDGEGMMNDKILVIHKASPSKSASGAANEAGSAASSSESGATTDANRSTTAATGASSNALKEDDEVQLTGTVKRMDVNAIERAYTVALDPEFKEEANGAIPVIVADSKTFQLIRAK